MHCYLMRKGHIAAVEFLTAGPDDALIEQGKEIFSQLPIEAYDGFEVCGTALGDCRYRLIPKKPNSWMRTDPRPNLITQRLTGAAVGFAWNMTNARAELIQNYQDAGCRYLALLACATHHVALAETENAQTRRCQSGLG